MLILLTLLGFGLVAANLATRGAILLVDVIGTAIAVYHYLGSDKIAHDLLVKDSGSASVYLDATWTSDQGQHRLMARHLRHALRLTELSSLFPRSCSHGYAIAQAAMKRAG